MRAFVALCFFVACASALTMTKPREDDYLALFKEWKKFYAKAYKTLVSFQLLHFFFLSPTIAAWVFI